LIAWVFEPLRNPLVIQLEFAGNLVIGIDFPLMTNVFGWGTYVGTYFPQVLNCFVKIYLKQNKKIK